MDATNFLKEALEPGVYDNSYGTMEAQAKLSIAISLKRIADALTGGDAMINPHFFADAAHQAGLSFEAGRRRGS